MNPGTWVMSVAQMRNPHSAMSTNPMQRPNYCALDTRSGTSSSDDHHEASSAIGTNCASDRGLSPRCAARYFANTRPHCGHASKGLAASRGAWHLGHTAKVIEFVSSCTQQYISAGTMQQTCAEVRSADEFQNARGRPRSAPRNVNNRAF